VAGPVLLARHQGVRLRVRVRVPQVVVLLEQGASARALPHAAEGQAQGSHRLLRRCVVRNF
jgi:hypothetical protein